MYWQAMRVEPWLEHDALRAGFADVFCLDPARIEVTDDVATLVGHPILPKPRILLEYVRRDGAFPLQLDVFLVGDELERPIDDLAGTLIRARALARRLNATMLLGDGPIGHDEQLRVSPDGTVDIVALDGDEMDEERFVIVGSRPFVEQSAEPEPAHTA
jgi:hypothetical protein